MLKHRQSSPDPFSFSSSPDRVFYKPKSLTSPNQKMQAPGISKADLSYLLKDFCNQLEMAHSSSPARHQPGPSFHQTLSAVPKPKTRPIKALVLNSTKTTTHSTLKTDKRRKRVTNAAQAIKPALSPSPALSTDSRTSTSPRKPLRIPAIVVRPASPVTEDTKVSKTSRDRASGISSCAKCPPPSVGIEPGISALQAMHLVHLETAAIKARAESDIILSKYLHPRFSTLPYSISSELLRFLACSICQLCDTGEQARAHILPEFCTQLFRHIVTGIFHLLDDVRAPYATAHSAAQLCTALTLELSLYVSHCDRERRSGIADSINYKAIFRDVLNQELQRVLEEGIKLSNKHNRLALPGTAFSRTRSGLESAECAKLLSQLAKKGLPEDAFVGVDVVRFIGETFVADLISDQSLEAWLKRFLVDTVHPTIPSAWEIECACAILITVGEKVDQAALVDNRVCQSSLLDLWMQRVDFLALHGDISDVARDWLFQLQDLRQRNWKVDM